MGRRFNIGDVCRIRDWDDMEREFGRTTTGNIDCRFVFTREMKYLCGKKFTIKDCDKDEVYSSEEDIEIGFSISADMLEYYYPEREDDDSISLTEYDIIQILKMKV